MRHRTPKSEMVGGVLAVLAVLVGATSVAVTTTAAPAVASAPVLRVSMYGDSVLLGARDQLLARFADQQVTVDAVEDRSLLGAVGIFRAAGPALGDVVVLDLGYNDSADPAVFRSRIDDAMAALAAVPRVIWLNQHDWGSGRAAMNAELASAASRYPNLDVVDWNAEVGAHPEYVYADSIHLTPAGQPAMATVVREHFDRYVASLAPTTTPAPTTTTSPTPTSGSPTSVTTAIPSGTSGGPTGAGDGVDGTMAALVAAVVGVVVVLGLGTWWATRGRRARRRARRAQRRASSSAASATGSEIGSRHAKRSQT